MTATIPAARLAAAALRYAAQGWSVVPLHAAPGGRCSCGQPNCPSPGKHPRTANGLHNASADPAIVTAWWGRWSDANIGLAPGRAGLLVIDVDGPEGERSAQALGLLSEPTLEVVTGRPDGGRHRYYQHPGGTIGNLVLAPRLDVRADHGYVLLPPSVHPSGRSYRWLGTLADLAELPPRALEALRTARSAAPGSGLRPRDIPTVPLIAEGQRHNTMCALVGRLVRLTDGRMDRAELFGWVRALNGDRCRPPLDDAELTGLVDWALTQQGPAAPAPSAPRQWGAPVPRSQVGRSR